MTTNNYFKRQFTATTKNFDAFIQDYYVSIILGEIGSGKTYELKHYYNTHKSTSKYVELLTLSDNDVIDASIDVVLLDSIDEVLYHNASHKVFQNKLAKYMSQCREINEDVKFVITCRYSEWSSDYEDFFRNIDSRYAELQNKIAELDIMSQRNLDLISFNDTPEQKEFREEYRDKSIHIYEFEAISEENINYYLKDNKEKIASFWEFTEKNYLSSKNYKNENILHIRNIQIILDLIENFGDYHENSYIEVYEQLIEKHLLVSTDNERCQQLDKVYYKELLSIASSVAFYMLKDNIRSFPKREQRAKFIYNLAQSINKEISIEKLNILFDTALFYGEELQLFDGIQNYSNIFNYLCAYYLNIEDITTLTKHKLGVVDKFINPLIHLTNIRPELFETYVDINPFIFTQHAQLDATQQERLLKSIINKIKDDNGLIKNMPDYFKGTIVKFDKLDNIQKILEETIEVKKINKDLYLYLLHFAPSDYFHILWESLKNGDKFREIVRYVFMENNTYNELLFKFMKENELFEKESYENRVYKLNYKGSFELNLFKNLYHNNNISFDDFIYLLSYISDDEIESVVDTLSKEELIVWFEYLEKNYDKEMHNLVYVSWCIYGLFIEYQSIETLVKVIDFLEKYDIRVEYQKKLSRPSRPYNLPKYDSIETSKIIDDIFKIYFSDTNMNIKYVDTLSMLFAFFKADIASLPALYPIENNVEKYKALKALFPKLDWDFLLEGEDKAKRDKEDEEFMEAVRDTLTNDKKINFMPKFDYAIKLCIDNNKEYPKKTTKELLVEYYAEFIEEIKENFKKHIVENIEVKKSNFSFTKGQYLIKYSSTEYKQYISLFNALSQDEVLSLIDNEEMYKKFFWLWIIEIDNYIPRSQDYSRSFDELNKKYSNRFIVLIIEYINLLLKGSNNAKVSNNISAMQNLLIGLEEEYLTPLINYIKELAKEIFSSLEFKDRTFLLEILAKDTNNFEFIFELMKNDIENTSDYLKVLFYVDIEKTMDNFMEFYNNGKSKELYRSLLDALQPDKNNFSFVDSVSLSQIEQKYIKELIEDFYTKFDVDRALTFKFTPNLPNMNGTQLWYYLKDEVLLEELSRSDNKAMSKQANILLKLIADKDTNSRKINIDNLAEKKRNPRKLVKILTNFTMDTPIKYTTHEWRKRIDDKYFNDFDLFLKDISEQFKVLGSDLKELSPKLYEKVEYFICSKDNPSSWKSMKELKPWVEEKKEPFDFPIVKNNILFKEIIESFKDEIEIRGNMLQEIFLAHKKRLGRKFKINISDNLKAEKFYTDVETFKNAIDEIFGEIEKYAKEQNQYQVEVELHKPKNNFIELHIIHIHSKSTREAEDLLERIKLEKGDSVLRKYLKNLCDWEIKASYKNKHFSIDCFTEEIKDKDIKEPKGFTHIMRFYK